MLALACRPSGHRHAVALLVVLAASCAPSGGGQECAPIVETCNGLDDDCDGVADQGDPGGGGACATASLGACAVGVTHCVGGELRCVQTATASAETCNAVDDDCDGEVDEGNPGGGATCATGLAGACAAGILRCTAGVVRCEQATAASAELCNGIDDDCDGVVDQGDPGGGAGCVTGLQGVCAAGVQHCTGGSIECVQSTAAGTEVCDGEDDDCDGAVDDGNPGGGTSCSTGLPGRCAAGVTECASGAIRCAATYAPSAEVCNGLDDDCNGTIDEFNPGGGVACSTGRLGVCAAGTTSCQGGALQCLQSMNPSPETCDGNDDDCDGTVDEGNPGAGEACDTGLSGVCAAGATSCQQGALTCLQATTASVEVCNGQDDDCDGVADDGFDVGAACTAGVGTCAAAGVRVCKADGTATVCNAVPGTPVAEVCGNGLDDDCDGAVDEGCPYAHTIVVDGTNDFVAATERFATTSAGYSAYVTWDASWLYVGYEGADVGIGAGWKWLVIELDDRAGGLSTGQTFDTQRATFPAGFLADDDLALRLDDALFGFEVRAPSWVSWTPSPEVRWARIGGFVELAIPFAALGDPTTVGVTARIVDEQAGAEWTYAGLYADAFRDGYNPAISKYLLVDRSSTAAPNADANVGPTCVDGVKNGSESDLDCGGACGPCATGKACLAGSDCQSLVCNGSLACAAPACNDLVKNGNETDVDCGGSCTAKCALSKGCAAPADCASGACAAGVCVAKTCLDLKNMLPYSATGPYTIAPDGSTGAAVYCDMTTSGGGWTIVSINGSMQPDGTCQFRLSADAPACGTFPSISSDWQLPGSVMGAIPFREVLFGEREGGTVNGTKITVSASPVTIGAGTFTGAVAGAPAALTCSDTPYGTTTYGMYVDGSGYTAVGPVVAGSPCPSQVAYAFAMNPLYSPVVTRLPGWGPIAAPVCGCPDGHANFTYAFSSPGFFGLR